MSKNVVILTPHPDDETLGCGGTLLRHVSQGDNVYWLIVTTMGNNFAREKKIKRDQEIKNVAANYQFEKTFELGFEAATLDQVPDGELIGEISKVFQEILPNIIYVPYPSDIHSDHKAVFDGTMACTKWFRYPSVEKVLAYETLSETDFIMNPDANGFRPNVFVNIESFLDKKIEIMKIYESEISIFPFPRSEKAIQSLAYIRGTASGFEAAEAFMLLKERFL
ncbi:PIG-L family deacetylase [Lysinibacillus sphaericus]|uniref:PIG-L deacetylase family protein n=1 Tax=Lysinibacillus sphaericus TaxID=1421 RepID=UPI0021611E19|nr:PIG-L family deacetylase [Lysinibacillus sphaericus]MCS1383977.1 PIG-L family deacetylase [Lysinibacillus sphaericus]